MLLFDQRAYEGQNSPVARPDDDNHAMRGDFFLDGTLADLTGHAS